MSDKNMSEIKQSTDLFASQQRNATLITLITFIVLLILSIITLFFVRTEEKTIIDNFMIPGLAIGAGYSYLLARRGKHIRGIYILLGMIAAASALYPLAADNVGWQTAVGMLLITTSIANSTLPDRIASRISTAAFGFAIFVVLIEIFAAGITSTPATSSSIIITVILAIIYLGIIFSRFNQFALQTKLVIAFITISVLSVGAVATTINALILGELTNQVKDQLTGVANSATTSISNELISQINLIQTLSLDGSLKKGLAEAPANGDFEKLQELDQQWRNAASVNNTSNSLIRKVLTNDLSKSLLNFQSTFPAHIEIFATDENGANIASTNVTSDYYQADEEWWQVAYQNGRDAIYISQPIFDENSQSLSVQIALPIFDESNQTIIGILRSTLDLNILADELVLGKPGESGRTEIYLPDGRELEVHIGESGEAELEIEVAPLDFFGIIQQNQPFMDTVHNGESVLAAQSRFSELGDEMEEETGIFTPAVKSLNWRVVTIQNRDDALHAIADVSRISQLIGLSALALAGLLAVVMAQYLTRPIVRLTQTAEQISTGDFQARAVVESQDEIGTLANSFNRMTNQLNESLLNLEKRVAERTTDLEIARRQSDKRASQLLAMSEISKFVNTEQKLDVLLSLITRLVSERFGFYHVGIFIIDETNQYAILQAVNSEGGQAMLKRDYKLNIGESGIIGQVAQSGIPKIALDVGQDATFFNNPDLPTTRSEIAIPLKLRDSIIGILDVQSDKPGAFTDDDASTLGILADQIAISIDNARLFSQTEQTLAEVQSLYRQNLQEGWKTYTRDEGVIGYQHSLGVGKKLTETVGTLEIQQALNRGETVVIESNEISNESMLVIPIKLRSQIIGVMRIQAPTLGRKWTANEINLSEAVSERLSLALENARLIQESQRQVIKEQTISEITSHIGSSINLENVLRTAVEELGRSIPGSEVIIKLQEDNVNGVIG